MTPAAAKKTISQCKRCGTCCRKGGPSLHAEDRHLVESGAVQIRHLFTIREGELARDNVSGGLSPVRGEIIKIKGQGGSWMCHFFDEEAAQCRIYTHRPLECRTLACWNTSALEEIYARNRLTREELLAGVTELLDLVSDHQRQCAYESLGKAVEAFIRAPDQVSREKARNRVLDAVRYDASLRQVAVEKGGVDAGQLDFLFGRPLTQTIRMFPVQLTLDANNRLNLTPGEEASP